ncbi:MAG: pyridoxamine kinase [Clostridia bacterium]|nr:pyridoxamine kinase [Clostridia bacterium]
MKRILTIQDISCVGKCSLTVALPIISAFGIETAVLPTAVLSTHTMFKGFTFRDLTNDMRPISEHWKNEKIGFDALYTGYLGSFEQIQICSEYFDDYKTNDNLIIVDPVMADNGKLYPGFTQEFADNMAKLCGKADIIVPNLTEASFMLHEEYVSEGYDEQYIKDKLKSLCKLGCKVAVLTGVSFEKGKLGVYAYDSSADKYYSYYNVHLPVSFHGTGDIFASALCGALTKFNDLEKALKIAVDYTVESIKVTLDNPNHVTYGVEFENALPFLIESIK